MSEATPQPQERFFAVTWEMEIMADNPVEAAEKARAVLRDEANIWAGVFQVIDENGDTTQVDLDLGEVDEDDGDAD